MDDLTFDLVAGWLLLLFGLFMGVLYLRMFATGEPTSLLRKLGPMQQRWGKVPGAMLHGFAYCLLPMVTGLLMIYG